MCNGRNRSCHPFLSSDSSLINVTVERLLSQVPSISHHGASASHHGLDLIAPCLPRSPPNDTRRNGSPSLGRPARRDLAGVDAFQQRSCFRFLSNGRSSVLSFDLVLHFLCTIYSSRPPISERVDALVHPSSDSPPSCEVESLSTLFLDSPPGSLANSTFIKSSRGTLLSITLDPTKPATALPQLCSSPRSRGHRPPSSSTPPLSPVLQARLSLIAVPMACCALVLRMLVLRVCT